MQICSTWSLILEFVESAEPLAGQLDPQSLNLDERDPITIKSGDPLIHIRFSKREGSPNPYSGQYRFQYLGGEESELHCNLLPKFCPDFFLKDQLLQKSTRPGIFKLCLLMNRLLKSNSREDVFDLPSR